MQPIFACNIASWLHQNTIIYTKTLLAKPDVGSIKLPLKITERPRLLVIYILYHLASFYFYWVKNKQSVSSRKNKGTSPIWLDTLDWKIRKFLIHRFENNVSSFVILSSLLLNNVYSRYKMNCASSPVSASLSRVYPQNGAPFFIKLCRFRGAPKFDVCLMPQRQSIMQDVLPRGHLFC